MEKEAEKMPLYVKHILEKWLEKLKEERRELDEIIQALEVVVKGD